MSEQKKNQLIAEAKTILDKKFLTREDTARFDRLMELADRENNNDAVARARICELEDRLGIPRTPYDDLEALTSFGKFIRTGDIDNSIRASQTTGSTSGGGALIPQLFFAQLISILKQYDRLFDPDVVTIVSPKSGAPMNFPLLDDVGQSATIIAENIISTKTTPLVFAQMAFTQCPTWRSGWILIPNQLLQDSGIPVEDMLIKALGVRIARGVGANIVSTLQSSALTYSMSAGQTSSVVVDDLYDLMGSVDPAYIASPKCGWAMNFGTLIGLLKLKDTTGRPILPVEHDAAGNFLLLEKPVFLCPSMPAPAPSATPIAFGDFSRLVVRMVKESGALMRATEAQGCAETNATGFQGYLRAQAGLALDSAQSPQDSPIKLLVNSAS